MPTTAPFRLGVLRHTRGPKIDSQLSPMAKLPSVLIQYLTTRGNIMVLKKGVTFLAIYNLYGNKTSQFLFTHGVLHFIYSNNMHALSFHNVRLKPRYSLRKC